MKCSFCKEALQRKHARNQRNEPIEKIYNEKKIYRWEPIIFFIQWGNRWLCLIKEEMRKMWGFRLNPQIMIQTNETLLPNKLPPGHSHEQTRKNWFGFCWSTNAMCSFYQLLIWRTDKIFPSQVHFRILKVLSRCMLFRIWRASILEK